MPDVFDKIPSLFYNKPTAVFNSSMKHSGDIQISHITAITGFMKSLKTIENRTLTIKYRNKNTGSYVNIVKEKV